MEVVRDSGVQTREQELGDGDEDAGSDGGRHVSGEVVRLSARCVA